MHDDLSEIENELRRLRPRAPSEFCQARVALALDRAVSFSRRRLWGWGAGGATAAACVAAVVLLPDFALPPNGTSVAETAPSAGPAMKRTLGGIESLEIQQAPDGRYFRPYRVHYLNTTQARPAHGNVTLIKSVPEEEMQFVPVELI